MIDSTIAVALDQQVALASNNEESSLRNWNRRERSASRRPLASGWDQRPRVPAPASRAKRRGTMDTDMMPASGSRPPCVQGRDLEVLGSASVAVVMIGRPAATNGTSKALLLVVGRFTSSDPRQWSASPEPPAVDKAGAKNSMKKVPAAGPGVGLGAGLGPIATRSGRSSASSTTSPAEVDGQSGIAQDLISQDGVARRVTATATPAPSLSAIRLPAAAAGLLIVLALAPASRSTLSSALRGAGGVGADEGSRDDATSVPWPEIHTPARALLLSTLPRAAARAPSPLVPMRFCVAPPSISTPN